MAVPLYYNGKVSIDADDYGYSCEHIIRAIQAKLQHLFQAARSVVAEGRFKVDIGCGFVTVDVSKLFLGHTFDAQQAVPQLSVKNFKIGLRTASGYSFMLSCQTFLTFAFSPVPRIKHCSEVPEACRVAVIHYQLCVTTLLGFFKFFGLILNEVCARKAAM